MKHVDESSAQHTRRRHAIAMRKQAKCAKCPPHGRDNGTRWKRRSNNRKRVKR